MTSIGKDGVKEDVPVQETSIPEPESWDDFFPKRFKALVESIKGRDEKKISRFFLTENKLAEAQKAVERGAETRIFLESDYWNKFLKPLMSDEQDLRPWRPGDARTLENVAVDHLFASGKAAFAGAILNRLNDWIRQGEEAKKIISLDAQRKKQAKEIRDA